MNIRRRRAWLWILAVGLGVPSAVGAQAGPVEFELEGGAVWQSGNDVEVPNDGTATRFSLAGAVGSGPWGVWRATLTWHRSESQSVRLLFAPLTVTADGVLASPVDFAGANYTTGAPVQGTYTFNSYRASYRWRVHSGDRSAAWIGFTAKIRDASIVLAQGPTTSRTDDVGFVPLLHVAAEGRSGSLRLMFDADALAGGPGRAIDASVKLAYDLNRRWSVRAGYRTVEGGADVDSVYNFAWLNYAVVSVAWRP
jgi:hypothetical protein